MKPKLLLLLLLMCTKLETSAQFAPVGTVWNYLRMSSDGQGPSFYGEEYTVIRDTVLGGKIYSQFSINRSSSFFYRTIDSNKVYYWENNEHNLLVDLNKTVGDTVTFKYDGQSEAYILDSIYYVFDKKRDSLRVFQYIELDWSFVRHQLFYYEKIMCLRHGLHFNEPDGVVYVGIGYDLKCYREPNGFSFLMIDSTGCNRVSINEVNGLQSQISLYPNPSKGKLSFQNDTQYPIHHLEFYDLSGKQISHSIPVTSNEFDSSLLPNGNYWVIIELSNQYRILKKVTVAN